MIRQVYISGALTGLPDLEATKAFYESIASVCTELGIKAYVPHRVSDPAKNADLTPAQVYRIDREQVRAADLVIAYVGFPSLGVGMELEIACQQGVPVVLLWEEGSRISRMARGSPAVAEEIRFSSPAQALQALRDWLIQHRE
jgi:nucleoside 2-deoxyribosyltransferase